MANEENGRGFLYPKKDRQGSQPNMTGKLTWEGRELEIAAWTRVAKSGVKYLSLKAQDKGPAEGSAEDAAAAPDPVGESHEDPIPF